MAQLCAPAARRYCEQQAVRRRSRAVADALHPSLQRSTAPGATREGQLAMIVRSLVLPNGDRISELLSTNSHPKHMAAPNIW